MERFRLWLPRVLLAVYALAMLWLLFGQRLGMPPVASYWESVRWSLNLVPFRTIGEYVKILLDPPMAYLLRHAIINLAGNVAMFVPLGVLLPWVFPWLRRFSRCLLVSLGLLVLVEVTQLFTLLGSGDVDDLILNLLGVLLGYALFRLAARLRRRT